MDLSHCTLCPRNCGKNRIAGEKGVCLAAGSEIYLARAALHFWEEPCISGKEGSGAVFFSGCNLHCIYCQNQHISNMEIGRPVSVRTLADIFMNLQKQGANNLNLVTPSHYALQIREALILAKQDGFCLPVAYNCSGYESTETLKMLEGSIDIYLTDFKYMEPELAEKFSHAADYPEAAKAALQEMVRQQPACVFDDRGMMKRGVIVRNLLLPGHVKNSKAVVTYLYETYGDRIFLSLMNQYTPVRTFDEFPELNRKVTNREYNKLIDHTLALGVSNAYIQEGKTQEESDCRNPRVHGGASERETSRAQGG